MSQNTENLTAAYEKFVWGRREPPSPLWHYTDASGLIGIATTKSLWCTEYRHLNDSEEISIFAGRFQNHLTELLKGIWGDKDVEAIVSASNLYTVWHVFVCSFCVNGDRNEHWHQYAKRAGYALGFDAHELRRIARPQGFSLAPVIYGEEKAFGIAEALVKDNMLIWQSFKSPLSIEDIRNISNLVCRLILSFAPFFKPSSFEREDEWRLVRVATEKYFDDIDFRSSKAFGLVAYAKFNFKIDGRGRERRTGSVPSNLIPKVMVGPGNETPGVNKSRNPYDLLKGNGFKTLVSQSTSSLRILD
jgi:hypothetical protein